ncbi:uncharacterized protein LOC113229204 isoform X2 [Hyposmocoma kahamanoa]|uniref:uncharacterized protein LOC113229204 isoform X2 n=1 Tax=Hyposmocoma kahamanoa TaxID=1477025 RepID=UPI000E6D66FC|nr:uncharacterized protein LOC113229204 isoform X2 [Hyposmocoma kahamanoa]
MGDLTMEEKCENMMNIVVESRKRFGKMCIDYHQKASLMENKILNLQLDTFSNYRFKSKNSIPDINIEDMNKDINDFTAEILARRKKIDELKKKVKDTENVVLQLKKDTLSQKMAEPLTVDAKLARAKARAVENMEI